MKLAEPEIREMVERILGVSNPNRIILFGSAVRGEVSGDSDIDLLVVMNEIEDRQGEYVRIRRSLSDLPYAFDIILVSEEWFEQSKNVVGGISYPAHHHGRVIYEVA